MNTPPSDVSTTNRTSTSKSSSLSEIIKQYGQKPDILGLILLSKIQEDRRRTEELKLRSKELDYIFQNTSSSSPSPSCSCYKCPLSHTPTMDASPTMPSTAGTSKRNDSPSIRDSSQNLHDPQPVRPAMIPPLFQDEQHISMHSTLLSQKRQQQQQQQGPQRRRKRMQGVTNVIETRDFPYHDNYLWKNNGNTVHKTSGSKSIYYKCTNYPKGCDVNKSVTFQDDGGYLIKYRGHHLDNCRRIKRVVDV